MSKQVSKVNKNPKVEQYLKQKQHPLDDQIRAIRDIILGVSDQIHEDIKWSVPTFIYRGNMASYFINAKKHVSLMFHQGASIPIISELLEGEGKEARAAKFYGIADIEAKKDALIAVVTAWMKYRDHA